MGLVREEVSSRRRDREIDHRLETYERNESPPGKARQADQPAGSPQLAAYVPYGKRSQRLSKKKSVKLLTLQCDFVGRSGDPALR